MMESLMENMKMKEIADRVRDTPNAANQVQYPAEFNNCVPVFTAVPLQSTKINTIIIATQSKGYPEESFRIDVKKTVDYFKLEYGMYVEILLKPVSEELAVLDSEDAAAKLKRVVDMMNSKTVLYRSNTEQSANTQLPTGVTYHGHKQDEVIITTSSTYSLRIVSLGVKSCSFVFTALEYMLNHWCVPNKYVQFITNGETEKNKFQKFWTSACVNQLVQAVQFVNLSRYLPFGYYDGKYKRLHKTGHVYTDEATACLETDQSLALRESDQPTALVAAATHAMTSD